MADEFLIYKRMEDITEQDDKNLAGARKEIRNDLTVIIPENPFPEIEVDAYPPLKYSWVIPKKLAAMAFPRNKENIKFLTNQGITHLVTLAAGKRPPVEHVARLRWTEIPVEEFEVPSLEQIKKFIDVCKRADKNGELRAYETETCMKIIEEVDECRGRESFMFRPMHLAFHSLCLPHWETGVKVMGIHCRQGRSRSGVMLACYLVHFHRFLPDQALNTIRLIRPGSCDFAEQEEAVGLYFEHLTEDNPLKFGVSGDVMEDFIQAAKECNNATK